MAYDENYTEPEQVEVLVQTIGADGQPQAQGEGEAAASTYLRYAMEGDAGADLRTRVPVTLAPFERALVPTGIAIALPAGYVALVHPRSGLAVKQGVSVLNAPGTVDAGYRGEIKVPLINLDPLKTVSFEPGDRIAQLVIQRYVQARFVPADRLPGSERSGRGFGSTGL
ncbi:deoxyuridine 5'-triphosphate nucleotidohydrolase [Bombiscardovia nodaiensis]|uniref:Deoxyuridine 5'-triphosphate nucleotidohydrolase n=1 Tax=Bombiscardovia nodaiensis TaxID=2932181 RepID=A0ABM8B8E2_9BIFI|nr:deoxyuridine 5'-triphosphate nucleotidohydrolase [Bombiscardovia nodaiensis]